jgi:hypothetical protein
MQIKVHFSWTNPSFELKLSRVVFECFLYVRNKNHAFWVKKCVWPRHFKKVFLNGCCRRQKQNCDLRVSRCCGWLLMQISKKIIGIPFTVHSMQMLKRASSITWIFRLALTQTMPTLVPIVERPQARLALQQFWMLTKITAQSERSKLSKWSFEIICINNRPKHQASLKSQFCLCLIQRPFQKDFLERPVPDTFF